MTVSFFLSHLLAAARTWSASKYTCLYTHSKYGGLIHILICIVFILVLSGNYYSNLIVMIAYV